VQPAKVVASPKTPRPVGCAIYTRKSTDEGLEQEFNSLDAQRECAEAYILSQRHEGWTVLPQRYDDGGFTGANTDRPALRQLLADVEAGRIDCVVVYKVDRLSRSLMDFARIMEVGDRRPGIRGRWQRRLEDALIYSDPQRKGRQLRAVFCSFPAARGRPTGVSVTLFLTAKVKPDHSLFRLALEGRESVYGAVWLTDRDREK